MEIEFDPGKDASNILKHGISLAEAASIDLADALIVADRRFDYGEPRAVAFAKLRGRIYAMTFVLRGSKVRVIGLRKANARERVRYGIA